MVLPARGGMGGSVEYQSNTLAAVLPKTGRAVQDATRTGAVEGRSSQDSDK